jgi:hypothetical protein
VLEKKDGEWWLTSPVQARADKVAIDAVSSQLQSAKFKKTIEEKPTEEDLKRYGLAPPQWSVTAEALAPGGKKEVTLEGGIENSFDGSVYLRRKGEDPVYSAEGGVRWALEKNAYELRDKELLAVDEAKATSVTLQSKANAWTIERGADKAWKLKKPEEEIAEANTVTAMFGALKAERALAFPPQPAELHYEVEATIGLEGGGRVVLKFGRAGEKTYALREDSKGSVLAEVGANAPAAVDKPAAELKDKTILVFKKEDVAKVVFTGEGGKEVAVERVFGADGGSTEDWLVTAPQKGPAKKWKLSSILWSLGSLKAQKVADPKDEKKLGLGAKKVAILGRSGDALATLLVGKDAEPGSVYVKGTRPFAVTADATRLSELPSKAEDVLDVPPPAAPFATDAGTAALAP